MSPLISVVIPYFNRRNTIEKALQSVTRQQGAEIEILVVDDNSTDGSWEFLQTLSSSQIRILKNTRAKGAQGARNTGILAARGEWIAFLDSDDEWLPGKLSTQLETLKSLGFKKDSFVHGNALAVYDGGSSEKINLPLCEGPRPFATLLHHSGPFYQAMLTSKWALEQIGLLDEDVVSYQEWDTSIRLAKVCDFVHIKEPLFCYHLHPAPTISKDRSRQITGYGYILNKFERDIKSQVGIKRWNYHISQVIKLCMQDKNYALAQNYLGKIEKASMRKFIYKALIAFRIDPEMIERLGVMIKKS
jgi:glycosyltransferase involved in cell wall biosynthesis